MIFNAHKDASMRKKPFLYKFEVTIRFEEHCITVSYRNYFTKVSPSRYCVVDCQIVYCNLVKKKLECIVKSIFSEINYY